MNDSFSKIEPELSRLNALLEKRVSYRRMLFLGIVHGFGTALGATIVAGIVFALMIKFVQTAHIPLLDRLYTIYTQNSISTENSLDKAVKER